MVIAHTVACCSPRIVILDGTVAGLSVGELAARCGFTSDGQVGRIDRARWWRELGLCVIVQICQGLGVTRNESYLVPGVAPKGVASSVHSPMMRVV